MSEHQHTSHVRPHCCPCGSHDHSAVEPRGLGDVSRRGFLGGMSAAALAARFSFLNSIANGAWISAKANCCISRLRRSRSGASQLEGSTPHHVPATPALA